MPEQENNPLMTRLETVEQTLKQFNQRLEGLERLVNIRPAEPQSAAGPRVPFGPVPPPPPVLRKSPTLPTWTTPKPIYQKPKPFVAPEAAAPKSLDDLEYKIGLNGMLKGGAVVIVIAIVYLVALAVSRGYITPAVQFAGEIVLCMAFVTLGVIKRDEREEFGQLMIGIGSCGLYLSFAGGHLFKHLYSGETLVAVFLALSFVNFGFALWRSKRSFLAIGMIGGLIAAMLPMHNFKPQLDVELHLLILIPTALIIVKNRWQEMAMVLWVASTAALIPALTYDGAWTIRIGGLYITSLICAATYAAVWTKSDFDRYCALVPTILAVAGIGTLGFDEVRHGSLHVVWLAVAGALIGLGFKGKEEVRNGFWIGSLCVAVALGPVGYHKFEATAAFAIFSILLGLASWKIAPRALAGVACLELILGLCAYAVPWTASPSVYGIWRETGLLVGLMLAAASSAYACHKAGGGSERFLVVGSLILLPLFTRAGFILLASPGIHFMNALAIMLPLTLFSLALLAIGRVSQWRNVLVIGVATFLLALVQYVQLIADGFVNPGFDIALVMFLAGSCLFAAFAVRSAVGKSQLDSVIAAAGLIIGILTVRLAVILLSLPAFQLPLEPAATIGLLTVMIGSGLFAIQFKWKGLVPQAWLSLVLGCVGTFVVAMSNRPTFALELSLLVTCILGILLSAKATATLFAKGANLIAVSVAMVWVMFSRFAFLVFTSKFIGLKDTPSLTLSWIIYAVMLMSLGFWFSERYLRYWSFGVFGSALIKIFAYDLSDLDPGIRVALLLLLGIGMVGAGYWYILSRPKMLRDAAREAEQAVPPGVPPTV